MAPSDPQSPPAMSAHSEGIRPGPVLASLREAMRPIAPLAGEDRRYRLDDRLAHFQCPALSLALIRDGVVTEAAVWGHAEAAVARTADVETLFQAASMSKPVAAILALQLVREGRVGLDDDINRHLTSWQAPVPDGAPVTLRSLLSHRSGATTVRFLSLSPDAPRPSTIDVLEGRPPAVNAPLAFAGPAGVQERYSNTGYTLIQLLIEDLTGSPMGDVARSRVFDRLGLSRSTFAQPLDLSTRSNAAVGYERGEPMDGVWRYQPQLAAAGLWTTPAEYARLLLAFRQAALGKDDRLLDQASARAMLTPQGGDFGLGWILYGAGDGLGFGHTGSNLGFRSMARLSLRSGDGLVAMTNADSGKHVYLEAAHGLAVLCGWPEFAPRPRQSVPITPAIARRFEGEFRFDGDVAPPLVLAMEDGLLRLSRPGGHGRVEPMGQGTDGRLFCVDSIFSLEAVNPAGGPARELAIHELGNGEVARVFRR